ncbi:16S rRNA (cytosine967-C5)-methyltransferase [Apostasia shenzhenica]|uniref:16S rRNA (Cytosine967-C5)-methyltransferase n=1 Tax=Apostasia shenzhenica TaxID=1088818 RepID=A0A2H9ZV66_9ASPA|nr:16S rRNA (cytosine967-C5)-methyltransferase [Apostasia shenzhenica]
MRGRREKHRLVCRLRIASGRHFAAPRSMDCLPPPSSSSSENQQRYCYNPTLRWNETVEEYFIKAYGLITLPEFPKLLRASLFILFFLPSPSLLLEHPSCYSCIRVNILKSSADAVMEKLKALLQEERVTEDLASMRVENSIFEADEKDRCLSKEKSHVIIKVEGMSENGEKPPEIFERPSICKCQFPGLDYVLFVKGSGPHSIECIDQPAQPVKEVIVSRKCAEAVLRGAQIFVPGVLACSSHVEKGDRVAVSVAVEQQSADGGWGFGFTRGTVLQGSQAGEKGMYVGQGITYFSRAGLFRALEGIAVEMTNRVYKLPSFNDLLEGEIFLQNLPSIVTAHVLDPQQGERILDMCAAPGGKTTAIAMLMRDKGEVIAVDRSHNKVMEIKRLAAEMDLTCIKAYRLDALKSVYHISDATNSVGMNGENEIFGAIENSQSSQFTVSISPLANFSNDNIDEKFMRNGDEYLGNGIYHRKTERVKSIRKRKNGPGRNHSMGGRAESSRGFLPNSFDRVLLDAPCSALGLRPRLFAAEVVLYGKETIDSLQVHAKYQRRMLDQAVQLVRPGGVIVYSTCTINPGENEALVRYALDKYRFLSLAPQNPRVGGPGLMGKCEHFRGKHSDYAFCCFDETDAWASGYKCENVDGTWKIYLHEHALCQSIVFIHYRYAFYIAI